jgi:alpha-galactosidase
MSKPKIVVIGAGSLFFAKPVLAGVTRLPSLQGGELCLVDIDEQRLRTVEQVGRRVIAAAGADITLRATTDRREAFPGADFVVFTFADRGIYFRGLECRVSAKYGVRMHSGDTIGPGGIFRTLRTVPTVLKIARDMEQLCPQAWVLNYTNPTAAVGIALNRHTRLKSIALCDFQGMPEFKEKLIRQCGLAPEGAKVPKALYDSVQIKVGGVNHFTWLTEITQDGRDLMPVLRQSLVARDKDPIARSELQLLDAFGAYPTLFWHTVEYVPYFQGRGTSAGSFVTDIWDETSRRAWFDSFWAEMREYAAGSQPITALLGQTSIDFCLRIINAILTDAQETYFVNIPNRGTISNLPDDAVLELAARVGKGGCQPLPFGAFSRALLGLTMPVLQGHELAVEAAVSGSRAALLQAFLVDPLIASIEDAQNLIAELLDVERDALPEMWYQLDFIH